MYKGTMYHVQRIEKKRLDESLLFAIQYWLYYLTTTGSYFGTRSLITLQPMR